MTVWLTLKDLFDRGADPYSIDAFHQVCGDGIALHSEAGAGDRCCALGSELDFGVLGQELLRDAWLERFVSETGVAYEAIRSAANQRGAWTDYQLMRARLFGQLYWQQETANVATSA